MTEYSPAHLRDLAALLALPRTWRGRSVAEIARNLADVLVSLLRLEVVYVRLQPDRTAPPVEICAPASHDATALGARLARDGDTAAVDRVANPVGAGTLSLLRVWWEVEGERALVVVGSARSRFPTDVESFLARVAVEQAMIAIHTTVMVEHLRQANAAKATFLATMSHELRTPLNAVIGYAELLRTGIGGTLSPEHVQHVRRIDSAARHLLELIEDILSFARLEAGKEKVHLTNVDAVEITHEVYQLMKPMAEVKRLALEASLPPRALPIVTDAGKVRQILLNLLSNALKFTPAGGRVDLVLENAENAAVWRVRDTGVGISAGDMDKIFEPFRQLGNAHANRAPGTGLGLSVSRQLALLLGGHLSAESTLGAGSTFELTVPLRATTRDDR